MKARNITPKGLVTHALIEYTNNYVPRYANKCMPNSQIYISEQRKEETPTQKKHKKT